jgi:lipoic acid synthetase
MVGLGETEEELLECFQDLLDVGVSVLTLGQYLQPTARHLPVENFVTPEQFSRWAAIGEKMGFSYVASGPLVRSSYRAGEYFIEKILKGSKSEGQLLGPAPSISSTINTKELEGEHLVKTSESSTHAN